jgi:hypothetical protein
MLVYVCVCTCTYVYKYVKYVFMYDKVHPEDDLISAETCRSVLTIIHVFCCICVYCSYIKDKITVPKLHGMESFKLICSQQTICTFVCIS